ncbi:RNA-directed DNA polymerase, eukaryota [Tanacetum coccineum]
MYVRLCGISVAKPAHNFKPSTSPDSSPAIVLDDSCILEKDLSYPVMRKIKDINALSNLYVILSNEGFDNVKLSYLGGLWILIDAGSISSKEKLIKHVEENDAFRSGGSILELMESLVDVGQTMGYNMEGCMKNIKAIVRFQGDFNEVRSKQERFGTIFNDSGAKDFNHFISMAGLIDLPFEGLLSVYPSLSSLCLDRHLSDHRPIIMRESVVDYEPSPFRVFHSWFAKDGFDKLVDDSWKNKLIDKGKSNDDLVTERVSLLKDLHNINTCHSLDIAQKVKICWAIEGDENSKYFHGIINMKRSQLAIRGVLVEGDWIDDPSKVKNEFLNHFSNHFSMPFGPNITLDNHMFKQITFDHNEDLESDVTYEDIKRAVWDCGTNKSPRPDGFTFDFILKYWKIIHQDVVNVIREFFITSKFPPGSNSLFITLIPKKQDAKVVKDFRPIIPIGSFYKIIAKILANRLSIVMSDLNSDVDFEKALDSVRWDYLDGSILINGSPSLKFKFHKGLKQGDPLSPFLFILVMESLYLSFNNILNAWLFKGIRIDESLTLSHLFYVDDAVFIGIGISYEEVNAAANIIRCSTFSTPFNYLGIKVGISSSKSKSWDEVLTKISSRLSKWKSKTLSIGGRLTLIKSVLNSLPLYHMSIYKAPIGVLHNMESFRRRFFNGVDKNERKLSIIGWKKILASKKKEGLGVSSFFALNRALLFKWVWRFISQGINLHSYMKKKVGNGVHNLFWEDSWIIDSPLKQIYPRLYDLESNKHVTVADKLSDVSIINSFRRAPRGGMEEEQYLNLVDLVASVILSNSNDRWVWSLVSSGEFSVKSAHSYIDDSLLPTVGSPTR